MEKMVNDYKWHCDYIQLAWESGFSFGKYQYSNIDKYKICLVDIERIIRERDVASVENQIPTILQYNLDNDQANVLDQNFVKVFRMSQLSVEYLLFCKKYLDGLVLSMKKQIDDLTQEKKEIKSYVGELESHLSAITTNNLISTFKCDKCPKVFSSDTYLTAHFKRRHEDENMKKNLEAEQLHSELRELRERLIVAEKNIKDKTDEPESEKLRIEESSSKCIDEMQKNFGIFKEQVESKIAHLKSEKEFLNDKYDKLFDVLLQYRNREEMKDVVENKCTKELPVETGRAEHTTQTEKCNLQMQTLNSINTLSIKETTSEENIAANEKQEIDDLVEQKIHAFGDNIENKISNGLLNIQNQMKEFCEKLLQLEANQNNSRKLEETRNIQTSKIDKKYTEEIKPMIKPRTKFTKPTTLVKTVPNGNEAEKFKLELDRILAKPFVESHVKIVEPQKSHLESTSESESEMDSIIIHRKESKVLPKPTKVCMRKSECSLKKDLTPKITAAQLEKKKEQLKYEINDALHVKLQEMGISPHWKGIPKKTFENALDIIRHQASQNKKFFPDYDKFKKLIQHSLKQENESEAVKYKQNNKKPNLIKIGYRKKHKALKGSKSESITKPVVSIKNRSLYDTDSEIERLEKNLPSVGIGNTQKAVIEKLADEKAENTDSDIKSLALSDDEEKIETRSALKTYPSDGSLVKKKVLFSMEEFHKPVASQVFDGEKNVEGVESSLSDLQIS